MTVPSSRLVGTGEMRPLTVDLALTVDLDLRWYQVGCHLLEVEAKVGWASTLAGADPHNQVPLVLVACPYGEVAVACVVQVQLVAAIVQSVPWLVVCHQQWL